MKLEKLHNKVVSSNACDTTLDIFCALILRGYMCTTYVNDMNKGFVVEAHSS